MSKNCRREDTELVSLDEIYLPQKQWDSLMRKDHAQIERMRVRFEQDLEMVRVVLRPRFGGGYNVEDGRHRVIAAHLAGLRCIEAKIVG
jgi:signal transduction histidine kinase